MNPCRTVEPELLSSVQVQRIFISASTTKSSDDASSGWLTSKKFLEVLVELAAVKFPQQDPYTGAVRLIVGHVLPFAERL